jgi:hypothetical protein
MDLEQDSHIVRETLTGKLLTKNMQELTKVPDARVSGTPFCVLWHNVKYFRIDDPDSEMKFSDRLAKENLWTKEYAMRAIEEYKKFMFLAASSRHPVTPSLEVDEVWHLHMLYTREYERFCRSLGLFIHHGPTRGGKKEDEKFVNWYESTKQRYFMWFSEKPPEDIWPPSDIRFRHIHFARIDLLTHWVMPAGDWRAALKFVFLHIKSKIKQLW